MPAQTDSSSSERRLRGVRAVDYDRSALTAGIVHIGVGNFHRAHQAVYLDRLFSLGVDHDWAIIGAGLMPYDAQMRADLRAQDWTSTVVELDPSGLTAMTVGAMIDYADATSAGLIAALSGPEIRIVSLTVTEGGYFVDAQSGGLDLTHDAIKHDIAQPNAPRTVFGCLIAALKVRRADGIAPFTIMSCDNLPENGAVTRATVLALARQTDPAFADWIDRSVCMPNGMVDCITPATSDRERELVRDTFGIEDRRPVTCEPFRQWVLEDTFSAGRPALEKVGVEFVDDVAPYELMKLRILNGGHAAIAYPAALLDIAYVHEAMAHPLVRAFLETLERREIIPTVPAIPGVDFNAYFETVCARFSNAAVGDTIPRLCLDGSNRQPKFILPTIVDRLRDGRPIDGLALEVALWCRASAGQSESGQAIKVADERADALTAKARATKHNPTAFLELGDVFGPLGHDRQFREAFANAITALWRNGTEPTMRAYVDGASMS